jgi:tetratricopeptide (TPR) repeat protein
MFSPAGKDEPALGEISAALDKITGSEVFRQSPQLIAFLRFVVEAALRGEGERIKGYTIAVEALGRRADFDPQNDPIVRTEAGRLRRALERYYAGPGAADPVVIEIARGSYVPSFRSRVALRGGSADWIRLAGVLSDGRRSPLLAALIVLIAVISAIAAWLIWPRAGDGVADFGAGNGLPVVSLASVESVGSSSSSTAEFEGLRNRMRDALARFDEINVASGPPRRSAKSSHKRRPPGRAPAGEYDLTELIEHNADGSVNLTFALLDADDNTIIWSQTFRNISPASDWDATQDGIVRAVATSIAEPFGVIHAREHGKTDRDPRLACLIDAVEYVWNFNTDMHAGVRACLEHVTRLDPNFAPGFAMLQFVYVREFYNDLNFGPSDPLILSRAMQAAQRAVSLKPQSAWAHAALESAYYAVGEIGAALAEGDTAVSLNPLDPMAVDNHGIRLVLAGEIDKGEALLRGAVAKQIVINANLVDFCLFLAAYLKGDRETASRHASLSFSDRHILGLVARLLSAKDDPQKAAQIRDRLVTLYPKFREDPRRAIAKFFPAAGLADRLMHDLREMGAVN